MSEKNSFLVFSGTKTRYLAEKICQRLECPLGNLVVTTFSDGEFAVFMDCDDSLCMDPVKLRKFCENECHLVKGKLIHRKTGKKVKAIVVVHVFGNLADMESIIEIANEIGEENVYVLDIKYLVDSLLDLLLINNMKNVRRIGFRSRFKQYLRYYLKELLLLLKKQISL